MKSFSKLALVLLVGIFALSFFVGSATTADGFCQEEEYFETRCEQICDSIGGWWSCQGNDPNRCCWEYVGGDACGEGAISECPECDPGACGF